MPKVQLATRLDERIKKAVDLVCASKGLKINRFLEEAILDKLEEMEDIEDLKEIRREPIRSFRALLKELKLA